MSFIIRQSGDYRNDGKDIITATRKEAEKIAEALRFARARVWIEEVTE